MQNGSVVKVWVLDFDGVICDSTDECMMVSWNAYAEVKGERKKRYKISEFTDEERRLFRKYRPFVKTAEQYLIIEENFNAGRFTIDPSLFLSSEVRGKGFEDFSEVFYRERADLVEKDPISWLMLNKIDKRIANTISLLDMDERVYIATLKDGGSVRRILEGNGIFIGSSRIYDNSVISNKLDALRDITSRTGLGREAVFLIDDNMEHLVSSYRAGYQTFLALWYTEMETFARLAKEMGIAVLDSVEEFVDVAR